jgi:transposase
MNVRMSKDASLSTPEPAIAVDPATLPDDPALLKQLIISLLDTIQKGTQLNQRLQHQLDALLRARFGKKSEKLDPNQLLLFAKELLEQEPASATETPAEELASPAAARKSTGRKPLPRNLPRKRIEYDIPDEEKACPCCGEKRTRIGADTSEQLEYVPASMLVIEHVRFKYACKNCQENVTTAPKPPQPIEKGLAAPGLLAHVITSKYADHLPLYRLEGIFARHGVEISRKTTCDWVAACADLVEPIYQRMAERIKLSRVIHTDATTVPVQEKGSSKTKKAYLSPYIGDADHPLTVFDYTESYTRDGPLAFLAGYQGYLQADAHSTYDELYKTGAIREVACWAHARRKFFDAKTTDPARAHVALAMIGDLYAIEREAAERMTKVEEATDSLLAHERAYADRYQFRQEHAVGKLERLNAWLTEEQHRALPKSPIGEAISYALNHWEALCRYTEQGYLAIDNNIAERAIKNVVIGRKNWLFAGSDEGGHTAAILFSLTVTCKNLGIDPFAYLRDVLTRLPLLIAEVKDPAELRQHPTLDDLLPDRWKAQQE